MNKPTAAAAARFVTAAVAFASISALLFTTSCGNSSSEFDSVIYETIVGEEFYAENGVDEPALEEKPKIVEIKAGPRSNDRIRVNNIGPLYKVFNDSNHVQLEYAERLGISPIHTIRGLYRNKRPIVKVESTEYFTVDTLKHSFPYLIPEARALLSTIGKNFRDSLASRGADGYKLIATSLLRTPMSVKRLRRVNVNSTENSTHQYGTTFDISYTRFDCADTTRTIHQGDLKNLLGEVLYDLRREGRCLVKFERKTGCFHITTTR